MQDLLRNGYDARLRPSGHNISEKFGRNNGGSVPPNLLALANTESNGRYQDYCRDNDLPIHPARYPITIPEYFTRFLTDPGDLVVDPFAGSCVTGEACEALARKWICCELSKDYLEGAMARFEDTPVDRKPKEVAYEIAAPCRVVVDAKDAPLAEDGGRSRPAHIRMSTKRNGPSRKKGVTVRVAPAEKRL
jgi:site-specific DNA-methyltransferase (cytosine-N4-specific)